MNVKIDNALQWDIQIDIGMRPLYWPLDITFVACLERRLFPILLCSIFMWVLMLALLYFLLIVFLSPHPHLLNKLSQKRPNGLCWKRLWENKEKVLSAWYLHKVQIAKRLFGSIHVFCPLLAALTAYRPFKKKRLIAMHRWIFCLCFKNTVAPWQRVKFITI
jgi:hypothetical protein